MAAITSAMEDVYYERKDFNYDSRDHRHPLHVTEKHFLYHLCKDKNGKLVYKRDRKNGKVICSARYVMLVKNMMLR